MGLFCVERGVQGVHVLSQRSYNAYLVRKWLSVTSLKLRSYILVYKNLWLDVTGLQSAVLMLHTVYCIERAD